MTDLEIEPGKFYRTKTGLKARIYALDGGGTFPIHGSIFYGEAWCPTMWMKGGFVTPKNITHDNTLVASWVEPEPLLECWVNVYKDNNGVFYYRSKQEADHYSAAGRLRCVHLREVREGGE